MQMRTMYLIRLGRVSSFLRLQVLLSLHTIRLFRYDTKLEFGDPTIIDEKYTSHEHFPSNVYTCFQNVVVRSLLFHFLFVEALMLLSQVVPFLRTIV